MDSNPGFQAPGKLPRAGSADKGRRAYSELYVNDARRNVAHSFDYAVKKIGILLDKYYRKFLSFKYISLLGMGHPHYVSGMSGAELAILICGVDGDSLGVLEYYEPSVEYWIGWILSYYQWLRDVTYADIDSGFSFERLYGAYPTYHECDDMRMIEYMDSVLGYRG